MIAKASQNGYEICICSGRGPTMYVPTPSELGIEGGSMYMVGYNGAVVYKLDKDGRIIDTLFQTRMTESEVNKVLTVAKDLVVEMDIGDKLYARVPEGGDEESMTLLENHTKLCGSNAKIILDFKGKAPNKISVLTTDPKGFVQKCKAIEGFEDDGIIVVVGGPYWCETINLGHDKEAGIQLVLDKIGLTFEDCIYFGDGANDATSLARCGLGIAMKGAKPEAIANANRVSQWTNDEDAVSEELKLILNEDNSERNTKLEDDLCTEIICESDTDDDEDGLLSTMYDWAYSDRHIQYKQSSIFQTAEDQCLTTFAQLRKRCFSA